MRYNINPYDMPSKWYDADFIRQYAQDNKSQLQRAKYLNCESDYIIISVSNGYVTAMSTYNNGIIQDFAGAFIINN